MTPKPINSILCKQVLQQLAGKKQKANLTTIKADLLIFCNTELGFTLQNTVSDSTEMAEIFQCCL